MRRSGMISAGCLFFAVWIGTGAALNGCAPINPTERSQVVQNLAPILDVEARVNRVRSSLQKLALLGQVKPQDWAALKEHLDVYYVYHQAAAVFLARGAMEPYAAHVRLAGEELDALEARMRTLATHGWH